MAPPSGTSGSLWFPAKAGEADDNASVKVIRAQVKVIMVVGRRATAPGRFEKAHLWTEIVCCIFLSSRSGGSGKVLQTRKEK